MRRGALARSRAPSPLISLTRANMALSLLESGRASAVKTIRKGKPEIIVRSEVGPEWEIKIAADHAHLFAKFFEEHGAGDGLWPEFSQTAKMERLTEQTDDELLAAGHVGDK
jgi:hypothetical protein